MTKRIREPLQNPTEEQIFQQEPLMAFSFYLCGRNNVLLYTSQEIVGFLDAGFSTSTIKASPIDQASMLMWYWTLGAYDVVRTISQSKQCFSEAFNDKITDLKRQLSKARMPNAKMEKQGKKVPVNSNRSSDGWDIENKDLLIGDPEDTISCRHILKLYDEVMSSLTIRDVKKHHHQSYIDRT